MASSSGRPPNLNAAESADPLPMDVAPIEPGIEFGPCLIYTDESNENKLASWRRGMWDGENWYVLGIGVIVSPIAWLPMPKIPTWS